MYKIPNSKIFIYTLQKPITMGLGEMCSSMTDSRMWQFLKVAIDIIKSLWMYVDIILDGLTVYYNYWIGYQDGKLPSYFWILGGLFMILPTFVRTLRGYYLGAHKDDSFWFCLSGPLYSCCLPIHTLGKIKKNHLFWNIT